MTLIQKCNTYHISYDLMHRLNYTDLLALVVECDIRAISDMLSQLEKQRMSQSGVEVIEANPEEAKDFLTRGR